MLTIYSTTPLRPRDLNDYREARLEFERLDSVHGFVETRENDYRSWLIVCWDRPPCRACEGLGSDPERPGARCRRCDAHRYEPGAKLRETRRLVLDVDGKTRAA